MTLLTKLEEIMEDMGGEACEEGYRKGHWDGYWKGIATSLLTTAIVNYLLLSPLLSEKLFTFEAPNFPQCLTVRPEQACSAYCNSPTFLR
jgi:hypothetical protein